MMYDEAEREQAYIKACDNVKKIAKAIGAIRIKYYPNFSQISDIDKETYTELNKQIDQISKEHGLEKLRTFLMGEVEAKYDNKAKIQDENIAETEELRLLAYYGAIDAEVTALSQGKIKQAMKCQEIRKKYENKANKVMLENMTKYKREKLAEIGRTRQITEQNNQKWETLLKDFNQKTEVRVKSEIEAIFKNTLIIKKEYQETFVEVEQILKIMPIDLSSKIPILIKETISKNKLKDYKIKIQEPISEQNLKLETVAILGVIYRDYISSLEEREKLQEKDKQEMKKIEEIKQEESKEMVVYKEPSFIQKIFSLIKNFFKKSR